ncbi:hypothetical protein [Dyadobacter diqingensis]|uniref:hypothetical protein n=1 Tax=Dyadobacter diqingensis TaxID=2938121 RepID=UPI0020C1B850|nr:hypothetical protein [Dyadobacter diqingensis]
MKLFKLILTLTFFVFSSIVVFGQLSPSATKVTQKPTPAENGNIDTGRSGTAGQIFEKDISDCNIKMVAIDGTKSAKTITLKLVLVNKKNNAEVEIFYPEMFDSDGIQNKNTGYDGYSRAFRPLYANVKSQATLMFHNVEGTPGELQILSFTIRRENAGDQRVEFRDVPVNWK